jgi:hypothetical protein
VSAAPATTVEEQLGWEARWRTRAGLAAIAAAVLMLAAGIVATLAYRDFPQVLLVDALRNAMAGGARVGLKTQQVLFYDDRAASLVASAVLQALGSLAIAWPLGYLYRATKFRRPQLPTAALPLAIAGPAVLAVALLVGPLAVTLQAHDFVNSTDHSHSATDAVFRSDYALAGQTLRLAAVLMLGFAVVLVTLNAMRVGLLTRFMGVLGIIVGVLFVIPLGSQVPVVPAFWMAAVGVLILGRWPNGMPPAWETGEAHPWPTQQELREAREREAPRDDDVSGVAVDDGDEEGAADAEPAGRSHSSSKKRKRKRRT